MICDNTFTQLRKDIDIALVQFYNELVNHKINYHYVFYTNGGFFLF
jgi:hypothetical protein